VFFEIVSAAGLNPKKVTLGRLVGNYLDQDGSKTGENYPINGLSPFKVVNQEGNDHYFATGWLDDAMCRVVFGGIKQSATRAVYGFLPEGKEEPFKETVEAIRLEIERSIPLNPIRLTTEGDMLEEYPPSVNNSWFVNHTRDNNELRDCVGIHKYCGGWIDRHRATTTRDAVVCRACHLRVLFPKEVKTYGELRQVLARQFASVSV